MCDYKYLIKVIETTMNTYVVVFTQSTHKVKTLQKHLLIETLIKIITDCNGVLLHQGQLIEVDCLF